MHSKLLKSPLLLALLAASVLTITITGGCPQPQQPQQPADQTPDDGAGQDTPTPNGNNGGEQDRPVTILPEEPDPDGTPGDGAGGGGTGGGTAGGGTSSFVFLRVSEPFTSRVVRPGATINVDFFIGLGPDSTLSTTEFVISRDANADGQPDGQPIVRQTIAGLGGDNAITFNTQETVTQGLLQNGFGRFLLGVYARTTDDQQAIGYGLGTITVDAVPPSANWVSPVDDNLLNRDGSWPVQLAASDTSSGYEVTILLDPDLFPENGNEVLFYKEEFATGGIRTVPATPTLLASFPVGTFYYYYILSDGIDPVVKEYAPNPTTGEPAKLILTDRLVGEFELERLNPTHEDHASNNGAILQGFNFNDLAGSSIRQVPDLDGDGSSELLVGARYGKPNLTTFQGFGWSKAYLVYGGASRLNGIKALNSIGGSTPESIAGLTFRGIRVPLGQNWTEGLGDIAVIDDMDGDELPELVFSYPRVESLALKAPAWVNGTPYQHPDLVRDIQDTGTLEYDAIDYNTGAWANDTAQFTRGGIVIVSSHNQMLQSRTTLSRKFDRVLDLHEMGQMFSWMKRGVAAPFIRGIQLTGSGCSNCIPDVYNPDDPTDCQEGCANCGGIAQNPNETAYQEFTVFWDVWLGGA